MLDLDQWELFCRLMLLQQPAPGDDGDDALCSCAALIEQRELAPAA